MVIVRNILAVILGLVIGSMVNMGIILISGSVIAPPEGADVTTMEGLVASMHLFEPKHFIMPFLAHASGTLAGAIIAVFVAASHKSKFAYTIGVFFMIGGIINTFMLPSPLWYTLVDVLLAYLPMAFMATKLFVKNK